MVKRIISVTVGSPMGFKVNNEDLNDTLTLTVLIEALKVYHHGQYVVGYDTLFVDKPHYHIHWASAKSVAEGSIKVFRSTLGKKYPSLTKADKLYTGQDLPSANPIHWLAYAVKEEIVDLSTIPITDELKIIAKSCLENKRQQKVASEKYENIKKEKQDFKNKMLQYVQSRYQEVEIPLIHQQSGFHKHYVIHSLVVKFLLEEEKYGSLKKHFIDSYVMYCNIKIFKLDEFQIIMKLYQIS